MMKCQKQTLELPAELFMMEKWLLIRCYIINNTFNPLLFAMASLRSCQGTTFLGGCDLGHRVVQTGGW